MKRSKRPAPPAYLTPSPRVPKPQAVEAADAPAGEEERLDPTRYGDWKKKGIAVDF